MTRADRKYLRVADLARLRGLPVACRQGGDGRYAGRHFSARPQRGGSEFNDYRPYLPGDPPSAIDWKVYGRTDRLYIRRFEQETETTVRILVDASASMGFAGAETSVLWRKYDHACTLAAALAFLTVTERNTVVHGLAREGLDGVERAGGTFSGLDPVLDRLERTEPTGRADLPRAVREIAAAGSGRGLLIVLSDLLEPTDAILRAMAGFLHKGGRVTVFHVLHPEEVHLPATGETTLVDSETGDRLATDTTAVRDAYARRVGRWLATWAGACRRRGVAYERVTTATPYLQALETHLHKRLAGRV